MYAETIKTQAEEIQQLNKTLRDQKQKNYDLEKENVTHLAETHDRINAYNELQTELLELRSQYEARSHWIDPESIQNDDYTRSSFDSHMVDSVDLEDETVALQETEDIDPSKSLLSQVHDNRQKYTKQLQMKLKKALAQIRRLQIDHTTLMEELESRKEEIAAPRTEARSHILITEDQQLRQPCDETSLTTTTNAHHRAQLSHLEAVIEALRKDLQVQTRSKLEAITTKSHAERELRSVKLQLRRAQIDLENQAEAHEDDTQSTNERTQNMITATHKSRELTTPSHHTPSLEGAGSKNHTPSIPLSSSGNTYTSSVLLPSPASETQDGPSLSYNTYSVARNDAKSGLLVEKKDLSIVMETMEELKENISPQVPAIPLKEIQAPPPSKLKDVECKQQ